MHLATVNLRMSLNEALAASTINSAHSLGRSRTHGSIEKGKVADLIILDAPRYYIHLVFIYYICCCILQLRKSSLVTLLGKTMGGGCYKIFCLEKFHILAKTLKKVF